MRHAKRLGTCLAVMLGAGFSAGCTDWDDDEPDHYNGYDGYGGYGGYGGYESKPPSYTPPPAECMPPADVWSKIQGLHADNEESTHELVKCGGLQTSMSRTFLVVLIASNESLFDADAYAKLVRFASGFNIDLRVPFEQEEAGVWSTRLNAWSDSKFTLQFHDPATGAVITQNPFVIDSYLTGVTADPTLTIDQMQANLTARNKISFAWLERGPLAHVLAYGKNVPNPFTIDVSFADLGEMVLSFGFELSAGNPNFGPLEALRDMLVDSTVILNDERGSTTIDYEVVGTISPLRQISRDGFGFEVRHINVQNGDYRMVGSARGLRYMPSGNLGGRLDYHVTGPGVDLLVSDAYAENGVSVSWSCPAR